jgi:hypothetical protein
MMAPAIIAHLKTKLRVLSWFKGFDPLGAAPSGGSVADSGSDGETLSLPSPTDNPVPSASDVSPTDESVPSPADELLPSLTDESVPSSADEPLPSLIDESVPLPADELLTSPVDKSVPSPAVELSSPTDKPEHPHAFGSEDWSAAHSSTEK